MSHINVTFFTCYFSSLTFNLQFSSEKKQTRKHTKQIQIIDLEQILHHEASCITFRDKKLIFKVRFTINWRRICDHVNMVSNSLRLPLLSEE